VSKGKHHWHNGHRRIVMDVEGLPWKGKRAMTSIVVERAWDRWLHFVGIALMAATLGAASCGASAQERAQHLPSITLNAGMHIIKAEIALTPQEHEIGLMYRNSMPANEGMLFAFDRPGQQCFWMKNTLLPLAVAFVADDGTIVNLDEMKPQTLDPHCSTKEVRFVLEMNKGWFTKRGIKAGDKLRGRPFDTPH
jgi:uncharacterized membrane protein (UPF0127 family)